MECVAKCVFLVLGVLMVGVVHSRYLPTRHGEITIDELMKALSQGKTLSELDLPNVELPVDPESIPVEGAGGEAAVEGGAASAGALGGAVEEGKVQADELVSEVQEVGQKRALSYQYICLDKYRRYRLCTRRYRRRK